jgi:hypothetical protein
MRPLTTTCSTGHGPKGGRGGEELALRGLTVAGWAAGAKVYPAQAEKHHCRICLTAPIRFHACHFGSRSPERASCLCTSG